MTKIHKIITLFYIKIKFRINPKIKIYRKKQKSYINRYNKILNILKQKSKNNKIRVCFLVSESAKWNAQSLYDLMEKSDIFEPFILVTNLSYNVYFQSYKQILEFYKTCANNVQVGWNDETNESIDLKLFNPDIVFYQQPWGLYDNQSVEYVSNFALTYYFSYAMGDALHTFNWNFENFYLILKNYFVFSKYEKKLYTDNLKFNLNNIVVIGHPKLDTYKNYKEEYHEHKYVIYAPHHSLEIDSLNYATFLWNGKYILEWAQKHPNFDWVFKPHPRLKQALILNNIMSEEEVNKYFNEWQNVGIFCDEGSYFNLFKNSKCLITDCGSFLVEYLPTKQPVIHLRNPKATDYIPASKVAMQSYYDVWNIRNLEKCLNDILINGIDTKKQERMDAIRKLNIESYSCAEKIINTIKNEIGIRK